MENLPRFTQGAIQVLLGAAEIASAHNQPYIGTEHLAMALLPDPAVQEEFLRRGINPENIRFRLEELTLRHEIPPYFPPRLTERSKLTIQLANEERRIDGAAELTSLHLLRGVAREGLGIGAIILESEGLSYRDFS